MARSAGDAGAGASEDRVFTVTTASTSAADDQSLRIRRYLWTMGLRVACFIVAVTTGGVVRWVAVVGAVILPYIAVVMANAVAPRSRGSVTAVTPSADPTPRLSPTPHPPDGQLPAGRA